MTANLLTLNSSKTKYLLTGLKNNLPKLITPHSVSLPLTQLAASALDFNVTLSRQISAVSEYKLLSLTKLSPLFSLPICTTWCLSSLLAALTLHLLSPLLDHHIFLVKNHWSLILICITTSMESTPCHTEV